MSVTLSSLEVQKYKNLVSLSSNTLRENRSLFDNINDEGGLLKLLNNVLEHIAIKEGEIEEAEKSTRKSQSTFKITSSQYPQK